MGEANWKQIRKEKFSIIIKLEESRLNNGRSNLEANKEEEILNKRLQLA